MPIRIDGWKCPRRQFVISMAVWPLTIPVRADERTGDIEWHVLFVTNQQRIWRRLGQLEGSDSLALVARAHSQDMLDRHFFDHRSPDGLGPADRVARRGLRFPTCSENLYSIKDGPPDPAELASVLVSGWMATKGHRHNILDPTFRYLGVGAAISGRSAMVTQLFAS